MKLKHILEKVDQLIINHTEIEVVLLKICTLLQQEVYHYNWVGFYLLNEEKRELTLGPFAGKPTEHTIIPVGKGVCGQVAESGKTMVVQDVTQISNYISCSINVLAEIVVPIVKDGKFVAEIDIDSHAAAPFNKDDEALLETIALKIAHLF